MHFAQLPNDARVGVRAHANDIAAGNHESLVRINYNVPIVGEINNAVCRVNNLINNRNADPVPTPAESLPEGAAVPVT